MKLEHVWVPIWLAAAACGGGSEESGTAEADVAGLADAPGPDGVPSTPDGVDGTDTSELDQDVATPDAPDEGSRDAIGGGEAGGGEDAGASAADASCVPQCDGLECGADGCGGTCGSCEDAGAKCVELAPSHFMWVGWAQPYCDDGICKYIDWSQHVCPAGCDPLVGCLPCTPDCTGKLCGDDGCGGSCGGCDGLPTSVCVETPNGPHVQHAEVIGCVQGQCQPVAGTLEACPTGCAGGACNACAPECEGKVCGPDGCGGSCGACGPGEACTAAGCVPLDAPVCPTLGGHDPTAAWAMVGCCPARRSVSPYEGPAAEPKLVWSATVEALSVAVPILLSDGLAVGAGWSFQADGFATQIFPGVGRMDAATRTAAGVLLLDTEDDGLIGFDAAGEIVEVLHSNGHHGPVTGAPVVREDGVVVLARATKDTSVVAAYEPSGVTKPHDPLFSMTIDGEVAAPLALRSDGGVIAVTMAGGVHLVSAKGQPAWGVDLGAGIQASPVVDDGDGVLVGSIAGRVVRLTQDGAVTWERQLTSGVAALALLPDGRLVVTTVDGLALALDGAGEIVAMAAFGGLGSARIVVDAAARVYMGAGASSDTLVAMDLDGGPLWSVPLQGLVLPGAIGPDGRLYVAVSRPKQATWTLAVFEP